MAIPASLLKLVRTQVPEPPRIHVICTGSRTAYNALRGTAPFIEQSLAEMTKRKVRWVVFVDDPSEQSLAQTFRLRYMDSIVALGFDSEKEARLRALALAAGGPTVFVVRSVPSTPLDVEALARNERALPSPAEEETLRANTMVPAGRDSEAKINIVVAAKGLSKEQVFAPLARHEARKRAQAVCGAMPAKVVREEEENFLRLLEKMEAGTAERVENVDKKHKDKVLLEMMHNEAAP